MTRIGVIGCGQWGLNYVRVLDEMEGAELVAACDVSPDRLREVQRRVRGVATTTEVGSILGDDSIDAVVVATQASTHFDVVKAALEAGKDVLVEKPMTTDSRDALRLRDIARAEGRILMVGHIFLFNAAINAIQQQVCSGEIGDVQYLSFTRTNLGPIRSDVNVVWDLVTHDVSILLHLMHRSPTWISAQGGSYIYSGCQDVAFITLGFENGVTANIRASWLDPQKVREITVVGTRKMVVFNDLDLTGPIRIFDKGCIREPNYQSFGEFKLVTHSGDITIPAISVSEPLKNQVKHFLECVGTRRTPLTDANAGLRVVEIVEAINQSIMSNGVPVKLGLRVVAA